MRWVVVGAGITGLAAAFRIREGARRAGRPLALTVLEAGERAGGHALTLRENGFIVEAGPNGFLDGEDEPEISELVKTLGLESALVEARPAARRRFVLHRGRLRRAPDSPLSLLSSDALSVRGKLRLLAEPWARPAPDGVEETVDAFARRRAGREATEVLVDGAVSGVTAGDPRRLSVAAAFPRLVEMERGHGSLMRALLAARRRRRPRLRSFSGGMETLVSALGDRLGASLRTGACVRAIERREGEWHLRLESGEALAADGVLLALPAAAAAPLVQAFDPELGGTLAGIPFAGLGVVALAFREDALGRLDGYGYLVPGMEQLDTLGVLWESSVFDGRAPRGAVLVRAMLGGARRPRVATLPEAELVERARRDLRRALGVTAESLRTWVWRWPRAIAQYELGHGARVRAARERARTHSGLELAGTSYDGASFAAAVRSATAAADRVLADLERWASSAPPAARGRAARETSGAFS